MQRYFLTEEQMNQTSCWLTEADAHHIQHVMRLKAGDQIICCDGQGRTVLAEIKEIRPREVQCTIVAELDEDRELPVRVIIAQALPKGDKMEWIVQKGTELGAARFIPFVSQRTIVKYDQFKIEKKVKRWQSIIKEAAEQSHRQILPVVSPVYELEHLAHVRADLKLVADEALSDLPTAHSSFFVQALHQLQPNQEVVIVIGPEGGLAREEISLLKAHGFTPIALGKRILRTETASQYVLACISFYFEQMGGIR
jgi:16S rRNA (uracil1498-N3)-methyltransferase